MVKEGKCVIKYSNAFATFPYSHIMYSVNEYFFCFAGKSFKANEKIYRNRFRKRKHTEIHMYRVDSPLYHCGFSKCNQFSFFNFSFLIFRSEKSPQEIKKFKARAKQTLKVAVWEST